MIVNLRKDKYDIYIGRGSIWGNPYIIGRDGSRSQVIEKYRHYILNNQTLLDNLSTLKNKVLGCYCKPEACHGDILLELLYLKEKYDEI